MKRLLKDLLLFRKITWDEYGEINRIPYMILGIIAWIEIISLVLIVVD